MELWVRSQDKLALTKINSIGIEYDKKLVGYGKICVKLGEYKTKERALEVLTEIQRVIEKPIQYESRVSLMAGEDFVSNRVYEMPKE